jgi:Fe-S-cluster containining protein
MKDVERLKKAGCIEAEFLDTTNDNLKNTSSGSCVLLRFDAEKSVYECAVYQHRPTLCRLYPFHFEKKSPNAFALQVMPCRGINQSRGEFINEDFIVAHLLDALNDLGL